MDDAALFLIFGERYRSCRGAKVYRNSDGSSKGLGFVRFSDQTDQQRALLEMNKYRVDGKQLLLKLAQPKYRAPRQARQQHPLAYDASTYYAHAQVHVFYIYRFIASPNLDKLVRSILNSKDLNGS
uniref:tRNA selenocysteine-associated protein 1 n=1 Tax=Parascaris equorum TaxID=6256 RepID=A0A914RPI0_PAREQ